MPINVTLPIPPTVNHMYWHQRNRRYITREYRQWKSQAGVMILPYKKYFANYNSPPYAYQVGFHFPDARRRDADNRLKPLQDLVGEVLGFDDNLIVQGFFWKTIDRENPRCEFSIWGKG